MFNLTVSTKTLEYQTSSATECISHVPSNIGGDLFELGHLLLTKTKYVRPTGNAKGVTKVVNVGGQFPMILTTNITPEFMFPRPIPS
jgi:hypothetical protein